MVRYKCSLHRGVNSVMDIEVVEQTSADSWTNMADESKVTVKQPERHPIVVKKNVIPCRHTFLVCFLPCFARMMCKRKHV